MIAQARHIQTGDTVRIDGIETIVRTVASRGEAVVLTLESAPVAPIVLAETADVDLVLAHY